MGPPCPSLFLFLSAPQASSAEPSLPIVSLPVSFSPQCGLLSDCARVDAIGMHLGTSSAMRFTGDRRFVGLSGWMDGSLTLLDVLRVGGALGGHFGRDETGATHTASAPAALFVQVRGYPLPWLRSTKNGLQLALSYQRSFVSEHLGRDEPPGFDINTFRLLASRSFGPVDLDGGVGVVFGGADEVLRRYVEASLTVGLRFYGLTKPLTPDEQLHVSIQALYRFALPGSSGQSEGYVLASVHERTASGYGVGLGIGPQLLGAQVGGLFMLQLSASWGLRYRNPLAESLAGKRRIPRVFMDHFYTDPILHADGCVYSDPLPGIEPFLLKCIGRPDGEKPNLIHLFTGGYVPAGTHLWVDEDGTLIDQDQMHVGKIDKELVPLVQATQRMTQQLRHEERKTGKSCAYKADLLRGVRDWGLATVLAGDGMGGAAALIATELGRTIQCGDPKTLSGSGFLPLLGRLPIKKGPMVHKGSLLGHGEAEHTTPVTPTTTPIADTARSHIYYGDVEPKQGKSRGWHYEPSADRSKGTYVIEETRSAPDKHGVYRANVMIEGGKKNAYSSFFPKHWSPEQVEKAIMEAYETRQPTRQPGRFRGRSLTGIEIEMDVDAKGRIDTAYPIYGDG